MSGPTESDEIYRGTLSKCGGKVKTWCKRAMVLKTDFCLYYYKDGNKRHQGLISLRDPKFAVRKGEKNDCSWPRGVDMNNSLVIVTTPRIYYMYGDTTEEAKEWREQLGMAHMRMIEGFTLQRKLKSQTAPSSSAEFLAHDDGSNQTSDSVPKRFQKKNVKVTQRFQTESDHENDSGGIELDEEDDDPTSPADVGGGNADANPGPPKRYKKNDCHTPTQRFQQEEGRGKEEGHLSTDDSTTLAAFNKNGSNTTANGTYEDFSIEDARGTYDVPTNRGNATQVPASSDPSGLIYEEVRAGEEGARGGEEGSVYEDLEIKGSSVTMAAKPSSSPKLATSSPKPVPRSSPRKAHKNAAASKPVPVEEALYDNKKDQTMDAVYDLIGYNPEQDVPPTTPNSRTAPVCSKRPTEELLYDVVKTEPSEGGATDLAPRVEDLTDEVQLSVEAVYGNVATAVENSVLKTGTPPPLPRRSPSMIAESAPPLPTREPVKPSPSSESPKVAKGDEEAPPQGSDAEGSRSAVPSAPIGAPLVVPSPTEDYPDSVATYDIVPPLQISTIPPPCSPTPNRAPLPIASVSSPLDSQAPNNVPLPSTALHSDSTVSQHGTAAAESPATTDQEASPGVPSEGLLCQSESQVLSPEGQMPSLEGQVPSSEDQVPFPKDQMPSSEDQVPFPEDQVPSSEDKVPFPEDQVPFPKDQVPSPEDQVPFPEDQVPSSEDQVPFPEDQVVGQPEAEPGTHVDVHLDAGQVESDVLIPQGGTETEEDSTGPCDMVTANEASGQVETDKASGQVKTHKVSPTTLMHMGPGSGGDHKKTPHNVGACANGDGSQSQQSLPSPHHTGVINLFQRQQRRFAERDAELSAERELNIQALRTVLSDTSLSTEQKASFGELLREIEQQKHLASEEKYKWERERLKFEAERQQFEEEKRRFQQEMEQLRASIKK